MDRYKSAKITGILGMIGNIFLLIIKAVAGIMSNSQSLLADAFNSAGDIFSSCMTFIGNKISSKEADEDHHLGHGKAEYIYSLLISISMLLLSSTMIKNVCKHLINREFLVYSPWLIVVCVITIVLKASLYFYTSYLYKNSNNILILANSKDHRNDVAITSLTLFSILLSNKFVILDSIVGIMISLWIAYTAIKLFIESYDVLMDKSMDDATKEKVLEVINNHKEVIKINHFNSTPVGYRYQISFTIFVDGNLSTFESHEIANSLEREIEKDIPEIYLTVIHVNPVHIEGKKLEKKD
ncbi:MAG: cation transporter [Bacilli bacterium]|nr:cation transporter [Bacilli bacterium]